MNPVLNPGTAAALPGDPVAAQVDGPASVSASVWASNRDWEIDRALMLERSERRAWWVAAAGLALGLIGIAAVFAQGPLRRVVEIPIVVDRVTGEATIQPIKSSCPRQTPRKASGSADLHDLTHSPNG